jgi:hypothetical protein
MATRRVHSDFSIAATRPTAPIKAKLKKAMEKI